MEAVKPVIIILGPTASGKTSLAVRLALRTAGEIISADSRQVYRNMDIGSGKDLAEYGAVPYHLIDIRPAGDDYSVSDFQKDALSALHDITSRNRLPIICGGTGHYVKALLEDYAFTETRSDLILTNSLEKLPRTELYRQINELGLWEMHHWESDSSRRMARAIEKAKKGLLPLLHHHKFSDQFRPFLFHLQVDRVDLRHRIAKRLKLRLEAGLIEEVEQLLAAGVSHERMERYGLEYRWGSRFLRGMVNRDLLFEKLCGDIQRYAKRQITFIRYLQKCGHQIEVVSDPDRFIGQVMSLLSSFPFLPQYSAAHSDG